jgi:hypothetical protein
MNQKVNLKQKLPVILMFKIESEINKAFLFHIS